MLMLNSDSHEHRIVQALFASQAVIEFKPDGTIITANDTFLRAVGYTLAEVKGRHHSLFCDPAYVASDAYLAFWQDLGAGRFKSDEFKRFRKNKESFWLQATYNPLKDRHGRVTGVIKVATDITAAKRTAIDDAGKIEAIYLSQAVIEFTPTGEIITANAKFLSTFGYDLSEISGKSHRMLCEPEFAASPAYASLWQGLREGKFASGEYPRIGKGGKIIYIQAAYNPIKDDEGRVVKVVKFAVDVTALVEKRLRNERLAVGVHQDLGGVIGDIQRADSLAMRATSASSETTSTVNSVAAAAEELSQSVRQIASNMDLARASVETVFNAAETANASASELNSSAASMGDVVSLIEDIASQINLLALNATIESARAGEAGRGFAVVASEVKALANQTTGSTKRIAAEINRMQGISTGVVESLANISSATTVVLANVTEVASALSQQSSVTGEISVNMQSAVAAVGQIEASLQQISDTFSAVTTASEKVKQSVETLVA